jgi:hypothetical protein
MKNSFLVKGILMSATVALLAGCVTREVVYQPAPGTAPVVTDTAPPPPAPQVDVYTAAPGPLALWFWAPGVWEWNGRWVWTAGHWVNRPYPGAVWVGAHWGVRGHHRVWVTGRWR